MTKQRHLLRTVAVATAAAACAFTVTGASALGGVAPSKTTPPPVTPPPTGAVPTTVPPATIAVPTIAVPTIAVPTIAPVTAVPTVPPVTAAPPSVPAGMIALTDTTSRLTAAVPAAWSDTDVRPFIRDDGGRRPTIEASPDLANYLNGWTIPGVYILALPPQDAATMVGAWTWNNSCQAGAPVPYSNDRVTGYTLTWSACGGGTAEIVVFAATSLDGTYSVFANVRNPAPDPATTDAVLGSIAPVAGANPGEVSAPAPVPALAPTDPAFAAPAVGVGYTTITDDTGRLSVAVNPAWTDVNTVSRDNDDLSARPTLRAAPSLSEYNRTWAADGLSVAAFPFRSDPFTILANSTLSGSCTDQGVQAITVPAGTGYLQSWSDCGGTPTRTFQVVLVPADQSAVIFADVQSSTGDTAALLSVLASAQVAPR